MSNMQNEDEMLIGPTGQQDQAEEYQEQEFKEEQAPKVPLVFSWGRNKDGELGLGNMETIKEPKQPRGIRGYVKQIATARTHTAVMTHDGRMFVSGSLLFGKTGATSSVSRFRVFKRLEEMSEHVVRKIACGDYHTLALSDNGALYSWGGRLWDKTGHKAEGIHRLERLKGQIITEIACGDYHSVALNDRGDVYSWGGGSEDKSKGQLGHGNKKDVPQPEVIQFFKNKKVSKIACGDYFTMIVTQEDELFAFGEGTFGQLGTGGKEDCSIPKKVALNFSLSMDQYFRMDEKVKIDEMSLGSKHSLLRTNIGTVYVCGYNSQGQLGLGHTANIFEPTLVKSLLSKRVSKVAAGGNHSLALTSRHDVYSCGHNKNGQLGIAEPKSVTVWSHVVSLQRKRVGRIYAGADHSWAVVDELDPLIFDYEPPSPIKIKLEDHSRNESRREESKSAGGNSMESILMEMTSTRKLQLIISETELSHRFIHFIVKDTLKAPRKRIQEYMRAVADLEQQSLRCQKLTNDTDVFDVSGQLTLAANLRGFTVMFVCELNEPAREYQAASHKTSIPIGELIMMDATLLRPNGRIPPHNRWFFKFIEMFEDQLEHARFIQIRPCKL